MKGIMFCSWDYKIVPCWVVFLQLGSATFSLTDNGILQLFMEKFKSSKERTSSCWLTALLLRQHMCGRMSDWYVQHKAGGWRSRAGILLALWPHLFLLHWSIAKRLPHLFSRIPASPSTLCHTMPHRVHRCICLGNVYFVFWTWHLLIGCWSLVFHP